MCGLQAPCTPGQAQLSLGLLPVLLLLILQGIRDPGTSGQSCRMAVMLWCLMPPGKTAKRGPDRVSGQTSTQRCQCGRPALGSVQVPAASCVSSSVPSRSSHCCSLLCSVSLGAGHLCTCRHTPAPSFIPLLYSSTRVTTLTSAPQTVSSLRTVVCLHFLLRGE